MTLEKNTITPELKVSDFQNSLDFYTQMAGFKILYKRPETDFAMLGIGNSRLMIEGITEKSRTWETGELEKPLGRGINFQIEIGDVQNIYESFNKESYPMFLEMEEKWYRQDNIEVGHKQFLVQDPDGYLLRFFQNLGNRPVKT